MKVDALVLRDAIKKACVCVGAGKIERFATLMVQDGTLFSFDGINSVAVPFFEGMSFSIRAEEIKPVVDVLQKGDVEIIDSARLTIKQGRFDVKLNTSSLKIAMLFGGDSKVLGVHDGLSDVLDRAVDSGTVNSRITFCGGFAYVSDPHRATRINLGFLCHDKISISYESAVKAKQIGKVNSLFRTQNLVGFGYSDSGAKFVACEPTKPAPIETINTILETQPSVYQIPEALASAIKRVSCLSDSRGKGVILHNLPNHLTVSLVSETHNLEESMDWDCERPFRIGVNSRQCLSAMSEMTHLDLGDIFYGKNVGIKFLKAGVCEQSIGLIPVENGFR